MAGSSVREGANRVLHDSEVEELRRHNSELQRHVQDLVKQVKGLQESSHSKGRAMTMPTVTPVSFALGDIVRRLNREGIREGKVSKIYEGAKGEPDYYVIKMFDDEAEVGTESYNMVMVKATASDSMPPLAYEKSPPPVYDKKTTKRNKKAVNQSWLKMTAMSRMTMK